MAALFPSRRRLALRWTGADQTEELWRTYYANIFNSARVKVRAMQAETPKKYWRNLPEARSSRRFCATRRNGSRR
jgi:hypothetical protein